MVGDLSKFQLDCLAAIGRQEQITGPLPVGLDVKRAIQDHYGTGEIAHGTLYPNLGELVEKGLVHREPRDERSHQYKLTTRGRRELETHVEWYVGGVAGEVADAE